MKNFNEWVKCPIKRQLTAKGNSFVWKCIEIMADNKAMHAYNNHNGMRENKEKMRSLITHLFIDKGLNKIQIIEIIKQRTVNNSLNENF